MRQILVIPDLHVPFHDKEYIAFVSRLLREIPFDGLVQLGDAIDFYQVSSYDKDPARKNCIKDDVDAYRKILISWQVLLKDNARCYQLEGNHEDRLRRYIWKRAPDIHGMVSDLPETLKINDLPRRTTWCPYSSLEACRIGDAILHHGVYFNAHTAGNNLNKYPFKFIQGHTHRIQYATNGRRWSATLGCGADIPKTMHRPVVSDWDQSVGILTVRAGKSELEIYRVSGGKGLVRGNNI